MVSLVTESQVASLQRGFQGRISMGEPMREYTSFRIGGPADVLIEPYSVDDLREALKWAWGFGLPVFILGNGTNLLVADEGIRGAVIRIGPRLSSLEFHGETVTAGAGISLPALARACTERGLAGLEWAVGIPGSLGGAITMNAGAYSCSIGDVFKEVEVFSLDGQRSTRTADEMHFAQRSSRLSQGDIVAFRATLALRPGNVEESLARMQEYMADRKVKQPLHMPSAGCIFQNPSGRGAGRYIDAAGLKGLRIGGAEISPVHANFIVNTGNATARDVLMLMSHVRRVVYEKFGVDLVPEVRVVGG